MRYTLQCIITAAYKQNYLISKRLRQCKINLYETRTSWNIYKCSRVR